MKLLVFFATYNEAGNVVPMIEGIERAAPGADILVVDDSSSDGTQAAIEAMQRPHLTLVVRPGKQGLGSAHLLAWDYAIRNGYEVLVTMDADLSHDPADIPRLSAALGSQFDIVTGSRYMPGGSCDYTGYRKNLSRMANRAARLLLRIPLAEFTTSYRAFRVEKLQRIDHEALRVGGYSFFMSAIVQAHIAGLAIGEVPIHFSERNYGSSKIPPLEILRGMANLVRLANVRLIAHTQRVVLQRP